MMKKIRSDAARILLENEIMLPDEYKSYQDLSLRGLFSIRNELKTLMYVSVLLFTGGCGILIYDNLASIGHMTILAAIFCVAALCFYFSFRQSQGFSKEEVHPEKAVTEYLVLAANILAGTFIAYLQYQFSLFGKHYNLATLIPTLLYFFSAYYFDHKGVLSLGISGLAAFIGFSASPQSLLNNNIWGDQTLSYLAIGLGIFLLMINAMAEREGVKKHFSFTYQHFALHFICLPALAISFESFWGIPLLILALALVYFAKLAYRIRSILMLSFCLIYGYIGLNILLFHALANSSIGEKVIVLLPFYLGGSLYLFIRVIKEFKKIR